MRVQNESVGDMHEVVEVLKHRSGFRRIFFCT